MYNRHTQAFCALFYSGAQALAPEALDEAHIYQQDYISTHPPASAQKH